MRTLKVTAVVVLLVTGAFFVCGAEELQGYIADLVSGEARKSGAAEEHLRDSRDSLVKDLVRALDAPLNDESQVGGQASIIRLLSEYRAAEAVDVLASGITFIPSGFMTDEEIPAERYCICAGALTKIGYPAIEKMLQMVYFSEDAEERKLAAWVLLKIEGKEQAVHRLTRRGEEAGGLVQEHCVEAIKYFDSKSECRDPTSGKGRPGKWKK